MPIATPTKPKSAARKPAARQAAARQKTAVATLTLSSKNYSSWSLRGWLMARFAGLEFSEVMVSPDDADARKELLLLAPSIRVPALTHDGAKVWNTLAIAQYLNEIKPDAGLMPDERIARAHCRSVSGEMNSGFANLRASLPMNEHLTKEVVVRPDGMFSFPLVGDIQAEDRTVEEIRADIVKRLTKSCAWWACPR